MRLTPEGQAHVAAVRERMKDVSTEQLKRMWDAYDGTNAPLGFEGEDIHLELNMRGEGSYCAV